MIRIGLVSLVVGLIARLAYLNHRLPAHFPSIRFCPSYVGPKVGHATEQHFSTNFPLAKRTHDGALIIQRQSQIVTKELAVKNKVADTFEGNRADKEHPSFEPYMMNWFPSEFVRAIITDPPVIILGNSSETELSRFVEGFVESGSNGLILTGPRELVSAGGDAGEIQPPQPYSSSQSSKRQSGYSEDQDTDEKQEKSAQLSGMTLIKSVRCSQTHLNTSAATIPAPMYRSFVDAERVTLSQYLPNLGVSVLWVESCFEATPEPYAVSNGLDHFTCDLELEGNHGIYLSYGSLTNHTRSSHCTWYWLESDSWHEIGLSAQYSLRTLFEWLGFGEKNIVTLRRHSIVRPDDSAQSQERLSVTLQIDRVEMDPWKVIAIAVIFMIFFLFCK